MGQKSPKTTATQFRFWLLLAALITVVPGFAGAGEDLEAVAKECSREPVIFTAKAPKDFEQACQASRMDSSALWKEVAFQLENGPPNLQSWDIMEIMADAISRHKPQGLSTSDRNRLIAAAQAFYDANKVALPAKNAAPKAPTPLAAYRANDPLARLEIQPRPQPTRGLARETNLNDNWWNVPEANVILNSFPTTGSITLEAAKLGRPLTYLIVETGDGRKFVVTSKYVTGVGHYGMQKLLERKLVELFVAYEFKAPVVKRFIGYGELQPVVSADGAYGFKYQVLNQTSGYVGTKVDPILKSDQFGRGEFFEVDDLLRSANLLADGNQNIAFKKGDYSTYHLDKSLIPYIKEETDTQESDNFRHRSDIILGYWTTTMSYGPNVHKELSPYCDHLIKLVELIRAESMPGVNPKLDANLDRTKQLLKLMQQSELNEPQFLELKEGLVHIVADMQLRPFERTDIIQISGPVKP